MATCTTDESKMIGHTQQTSRSINTRNHKSNRRRLMEHYDSIPKRLATSAGISLLIRSCTFTDKADTEGLLLDRGEYKVDKQLFRLLVHASGIVVRAGNGDS